MNYYTHILSWYTHLMTLALTRPDCEARRCYLESVEGNKESFISMFGREAGDPDDLDDYNARVVDWADDEYLYLQQLFAEFDPPLFEKYHLTVSRSRKLALLTDDPAP